jgi:hypothetical protein
MTGYGPDEVLGHNWWVLQGGCQAAVGAGVQIPGGSGAGVPYSSWSSLIQDCDAHTSHAASQQQCNCQAVWS